MVRPPNKRFSLGPERADLSFSFSPPQKKKTTTYLPCRLVFLARHSLHAISSQLSPVPGCKGIELLQAETFDLHNFQTPTGIKFFAVAECNSQGVDRFLKR